MRGLEADGSLHALSGGESRWAGEDNVAVDTVQNRNGYRFSWLWILALLFAVSWHVVWWVWLSADPIEARLVLPETPRVSYMPVTIDTLNSKGDIHTKIRTLWSPALFSLPSQVGFSRSILTNEIGVRPPLAMPDGDSRFLERLPSMRINMPAEPLPLDMNRVVKTLETYAPRASLSPVFTSLSVTGVIVKVELSEGLTGRHFKHMNLPELPALCREKPWEAAAWLEVDPEGRVTHVFLEKKSPAESYDADLVRNIFAWRLKNPGKTVTGRVVVRCFASTRTASQKSEGGVP